jgi:hypothetical protein
LIELLYEAMVNEIGIIVSCSDPQKLSIKLRMVKNKDPFFEKLSFYISPINPTSELWIVKIDGEL